MNGRIKGLIRPTTMDIDDCIVRTVQSLNRVVQQVFIVE